MGYTFYRLSYDCLRTPQLVGFRTALAWPGYDSELITTDPDNVFRSYIVKHDPDLRNGPKKGLSKSHVWSISGSEFHTCFAFGNADGWLKIINMQSPRYRKIASIKSPVRQIILLS